MPRSFSTRHMKPQLHPGVAGAIGDICTAGDGNRYVKIGSGDTDWRLETDPSAAAGGGPFRTAGDNGKAKPSDNDPHRSWLMANSDWNYVEMDWSDKFGVPARIAWNEPDGDGEVLVEVRTNAFTDGTGNQLRINKPRLGGIKKITINDRDNGGIWAADPEVVANTAYWSTAFSVNLQSGPLGVRGTEIRERSRVAARAFLAAYEEISKRRVS